MEPQEQLEKLEELRRRALVIAQAIMGDHEPNMVYVDIRVHRSPNIAGLVDTANGLGWLNKVSKSGATRWVQTVSELGDVTIFDDRPVDHCVEAEENTAATEQHAEDEAGYNRIVSDGLGKR